jgi:hypothetical protein
MRSVASHVSLAALALLAPTAVACSSTSGPSIADHASALPHATGDAAAAPTAEATPAFGAHAIAAELRGRAALAWPKGAVAWTAHDGALTPELPAAAGTFHASGDDRLVVDLPAHADGATRLSWRGLPGFWIELTPEGVAPVRGEVVDAALIYPAATRATDVVHVARPAAIEELRVLRSAEAPRTMRWSLRKGPDVASVRVEDDGSLAVAHVGGSARFVAPRPFALDADGARLEVATRIEDVGARSTLELALGALAPMRFPVVVDPQWAATASMTTPRVLHQATLLADGRVLVTGGTTTMYAADYSTTEIYDEKTGVFTAGPPMANPRATHTATLLPDGRVLVAGGMHSVSFVPSFLSSVEIYDPTANAWSAGAALPLARAQHAAGLVTGPKLVLVGGKSASATFHTGAVTYDVATKTWSSIQSGTMNPSRIDFGSALSGDTFVLGGGFSATAQLSTSATYVQSTMGPFWSGTATMLASHGTFELAALASGDVLAAGGNGAIETEVFSIKSNKWTSAGSMSAPHTGSTATVLDDGRVLVVGDQGADVYDPAQPINLAWKAAGTLTTKRNLHRAVKLQSGRVLVVGGKPLMGGAATSAAELFSAYATGSPCADASECASGFCVDGVCCDRACDGQCEACDLAKKGACGNVNGAPHGKRAACAGAASCVDDVAIAAPVCNGSGACAAPAPVSCAPYACQAGSCPSACTSNADCVAGNVCFQGRCAQRLGVCSADRTATTLAGQTTPTPCVAYACRDDGTCGQSCASTSDCTPGYTCDVAAKSCVSDAPIAATDSGGCGVPGAVDARGGAGAGAALALLGWVIARRRRR